MKATTPRGTLFPTVVRLSSLALPAVVDEVRARYESEFGPSPADTGGWYHPADWQRIGFVLEALRPGGRFLDVGLGAGQFVNAVAKEGIFDEVHGADPYRFNKYIEFGGDITRTDSSVGELPFPDDHFDVVTCMEVLEHVPDEIFEQGLAELRRVCRGQLVMSVPFEEPEPIYEGHRRRFVETDIREHFPSARRVLLYRPLAPWALMEEWCGEGAGPPSTLESVAVAHGAPFTARWRFSTTLRTRASMLKRRVARWVRR